MIDIPVRLGPRSYRILVGAGILAGAGAELARLKVGGKVALVTDPTILSLHGAAVSRSLAEAGFNVTPVLLPEGERAKTLEVAASTWDRFLEAGLEKAVPGRSGHLERLGPLTLRQKHRSDIESRLGKTPRHRSAMKRQDSRIGDEGDLAADLETRELGSGARENTGADKNPV